MTLDAKTVVEVKTLEKVFVANPNKQRDVKIILVKNQEKLLELLHNLSPAKGSEDEQFEEEKELIIQEIERISLDGFGTGTPPRPGHNLKVQRALIEDLRDRLPKESLRRQ